MNPVIQYIEIPFIDFILLMTYVSFLGGFISFFIHDIYVFFKNIICTFLISKGYLTSSREFKND